MNEVEKLAEQAKEEVKVQETVNLPWLEKKMLEDHVLVQMPDPVDPKKVITRMGIEKVVMDFKSFVIKANNRELNWHMTQLLVAIKMLMDVCEKQQNDIDDLNSEVSQLRKHLVI